MWSSITKGVTPGKKYDYSKQYKNPQTGQVIVPFAKTFDPEQVEKIADQASSLIKDNKSAKAYYTKMLNNPLDRDLILAAPFFNAAPTPPNETFFLRIPNGSALAGVGFFLSNIPNGSSWSTWSVIHYFLYGAIY